MPQVDLSLLDLRERFVKRYGPKLLGDHLLLRGNRSGYIAWVLAHPQQAPWGMLVGDDVPSEWPGSEDAWPWQHPQDEDLLPSVEAFNYRLKLLEFVSGAILIVALLLIVATSADVLG
jgi:hypothetical protein